MRAYSNDVCTWGTRMGRRCNAGGNGRRRTVCRLMHNSRSESIDTSSPLIAHEYETNATPVTYGVFPRSWHLFFSANVFGLVKLEKSDAEKNKRKTIRISHEYLTCSMQKSSANIATKFRITRLGKIFEECFTLPGRNFLTSSLFFSVVCNFLLEQFSI